MPIYSFENIKTGKEYTEQMSMSELDSYLKDDDNILKNLIVEPYFDLLDETIEKVEALYQKDIE